MRTTNIAERVCRIGESPFVRLGKLVERFPDAINLSGAVPDVPVHPYIIDSVSKAVKDNLVNNYSEVPGLKMLREAICNMLNNEKSEEINPDQIIVTVGASEGLTLVFQALVEPGDVVLMLSPCYPTHIESVILAGGNIEFINLEESDDWEFDSNRLIFAWEKLVRKYGCNPKAIVLCDPLNPTGSCLSEKNVEDIVELAIRKQIWVIVDCVYERFVFDGRKQISLRNYPELYPKLINCFSLSKTYAMPGWRVGFLIVPQLLLHDLLTIHDQIAICAPLVSQYAAIAALSVSQEWTSKLSRIIDVRRKIMINGFESLKTLSLARPIAGMFGFPKISITTDSVKFSEILAEEAGVLTFPGLGFGPSGEGHVRISFGVKEDVLRLGISRLKEWERNRPLAKVFF